MSILAAINSWPATPRIAYAVRKDQLGDFVLFVNSFNHKSIESIELGKDADGNEVWIIELNLTCDVRSAFDQFFTKDDFGGIYDLNRISREQE